MEYAGVLTAPASDEVDTAITSPVPAAGLVTPLTATFTAVLARIDAGVVMVAVAPLDPVETAVATIAFTM